MPSIPSSPNLLERMLKENSELTERVTSLSQERATLKHRLTCLERQLRRTENELAKVTTETENRPISDVTSNTKVSRKHVLLHTFSYDTNNGIILKKKIGSALQEQSLQDESLQCFVCY